MLTLNQAIMRVLLVLFMLTHFISNLDVFETINIVKSFVAQLIPHGISNKDIQDSNPPLLEAPTIKLSNYQKKKKKKKPINIELVLTMQQTFNSNGS
jgi:hypothetical protein